ncbi:hypothetical protein GOV12_01595 [Candidatus Pacearchaeota archaeon]|nr:hypothetical protein [Candidatus Pacearchaeota archaeon]
MEFINILAILIVILILGIIIWYLYSLNKKLSNKIDVEKNRFILYKKQLKELDKIDLTKTDLEKLNKLARDFFKERFNMNYSMTYLELANKFKEDRFDERVEFCHLMSDVLYSDKKIDTRDIRRLLMLLSDIIEDYQALG